MFVNAIDIAAKFTRPVFTLSRAYGTTAALPGTATLFLINSDGWAMTCRHVAETILAAQKVNLAYEEFKGRKSAIPAGKRYRKDLEQLEAAFGYNRERQAQFLTSFVDCVDKMSDFTIHLHPKYDVALVKFNGFGRVFCDRFPIFAADGSGLRQGRSICRLGFPFPEFRNFGYDAASDTIQWLPSDKAATPQFPIEGMVTRHIADQEANLFGFELSTPGLRGQSGGPAFDVEGRVWGMQSATNHLDLDFDMDVEVMRGGRRRRITNTPFLHVGNCVHVDVLKDFMRALGVRFQEG